MAYEGEGAGGADSAAAVAAVANLSQFGLIHFSGADAQAFLQGQLSCDVNALQAGQAIYGSYNSPKGRMLASFLLWRDTAGYVMQLPRSLCGPICKRLSMYILRSKVKACDVSDDHMLLGIAGIAAEELLAQHFKTIPAAALTTAAAGGTQLLRLDAARWLLVADRASGGEILNALLKKAQSVSDAAWELTNIEAGIPFITPATQDQFVPQMANLDLLNGVSFSKGCYPGQEIVARMHYLGKLKQRMYLAEISGTDVPAPGNKLYSAGTGEQATGMIVNAAPSPGGGHTALAVMHIASFQSGEVHLNAPAGPALKFRPLPYAIPADPP